MATFVFSAFDATGLLVDEESSLFRKRKTLAKDTICKCSEIVR